MLVVSHLSMVHHQGCIFFDDGFQIVFHQLMVLLKASPMPPAPCLLAEWAVGVWFFSVLSVSACAGSLVSGC